MGAVKPNGTGIPSLEELQGCPPVEIVGKGRQVKTLALDISSSCIGWALGVDGKPSRWGKFVFKTTAQAGGKLCAWDEFFAGLLDVFQPDRVVIEKPLSRRANTTARHYELLGITKKVWTEKTGTEIKESWLIPVTTIKRVMGVPRGKDHKSNKQIMLARVSQLLGINLKYSDSKLTSMDDVADALAVLITYYRRGAPLNPS